MENYWIPRKQLNSIKIAISVEYSRYSAEKRGNFPGQSYIKEIFGKISIYRIHQILAQFLVKHNRNRIENHSPNNQKNNVRKIDEIDLIETTNRTEGKITDLQTARSMHSEQTYHRWHITNIIEYCARIEQRFSDFTLKSTHTKQTKNWQTEPYRQHTRASERKRERDGGRESEEEREKKGQREKKRGRDTGLSIPLGCMCIKNLCPNWYYNNRSRIPQSTY